MKIQRSKNLPYMWLQEKMNPSLIGVLDKATSYEMANYEYTQAFANGWNGRVQLLRQAKNGAYFFPEGLLPKVIQILKAFGHTIEYTPRTPPNKILNFDWNGPNLRDYQITTINETLTKLNGGQGCIVNLATGSGKSLICMWLIRELGVPTLITVHSHELMKQWKENIEKTLNFTPAIYGGKIKDHNDITIAMIQTLTKDTKLNLDQFNFIEFDETHKYAAPIFSKVAMKCNAYYKIGTTATPYREDGAELKFIGGIGSIICPINAKQLIERGFLAKPTLIIHRPPSPEKLGYTYQQEYNNGIILNEGRNQMIATIAKQYINEGKQIYVNVTRINHGKRLSFLIGCEFIDAKAKNRESEITNFSSGTSRCIVSTLLSDGFDLPSLDVIIMASAGKSATSLIQRAGRVLRTTKDKKTSIIVDFADSGKRLRQHFEKRRQTYREVLGI